MVLVTSRRPPIKQAGKEHADKTDKEKKIKRKEEKINKLKEEKRRKRRYKNKLTIRRKIN